MDIVFEIIAELYMELMFLIVPQDKRSKKHYVLTWCTALLFTIGVVALGIWGVALIVAHGKWTGLVPLIFAILISAVQISLGAVLFFKRTKKEEASRKLNDGQE